MVKKKSHTSLFSTLAQQITNESSSGEYHLIDNEYFAAFNTLDDIEQFHDKLIQKQSINTDEDNDLHQSEQDDNEMDMKRFAKEYLIDLPEHEILNTDVSPKKRKEIISVRSNNKRQRRNIRDLPQSSNFIFMGDDDHTNIFDSLKEKKSSRSNRIAYEDMRSILLTLDVKQKKRKQRLLRNINEEATIAIELAESSIIKNEPSEPEQLVITHVVETKEEPIELNVIPTGPMGFGTSEYSGDLDKFVQNIHHSCSTNVSISASPLTRPKRIRKRKRLYIEESEVVIQPRKIRKKKSQTNPTSTLLTDAEIEQQFGERLSPMIKSEQDDDDTQQISNNRIIIEIESVTQTPIEQARAKLTNALGRGHSPDTYLLKIRSRESKMIEIQLAIYGTADWHSHRTKLLSKIEEALRGLRVSWTKIDIRVDEFDVQICTSPQTPSIVPPTPLINNNSSWFLKALSDSGPLIVHIHDRRHPHQRHLIKCLCPQCSPNEQSIEPSLPIIVSVSPAKTPTRRLLPPTILRKTQQTINSTISALHNIHTIFFKDLIHQYGTNTVSSVTQCVLDLTLIISVHSSLSNLHVPINYPSEEYRKKYQQIIDPLKYTMNEIENVMLPKSMMNTTLIEPDILTFNRAIKQNKANIRSAQSMRNLITSSFSKPNVLTTSTSSNVIKATPITTLILPKQTSSLSLSSTTNRRPILMNRFNKRNRNQLQTNDHNNGMKQQAHFTPIIELKPILSGTTIVDESINDELLNKKFTKIISTNTIQKDLQRVDTITTREMTPQLANNARVIRLSIAKPSLNTIQPKSITPNQTSPPTIRLISSSVNKIETTTTAPLIPKQINIIKPFSSSSSTTAPIKLSNPILISNRSQQPLTK